MSSVGNLLLLVEKCNFLSLLLFNHDAPSPLTVAA